MPKNTPELEPHIKEAFILLIRALVDLSTGVRIGAPADIEHYTSEAEKQAQQAAISLGILLDI